MKLTTTDPNNRSLRNSARSDGSWSVGAGEDSSTSQDDRPYGMDDIEQEKTEEEAVAAITRRETKSVRAWRLTTLLTMSLAAAAVCITSYRFLKDRESNSFRDDFNLLALSIRDSAKNHMTNLYTASRNVAEQVTQAAAANGETFPFVTVPLYEVMASQARETTGIEQLFWTPLIDDDTLLEWGRYSSQNIGWLNDSIAYHLSQSEQTSADEYDLSQFIPAVLTSGPNGLAPAKPGSGGPWEPLWQISPPFFQSVSINFNVRLLGVGSIEQAADQLRAGMIGPVSNYAYAEGLTASAEEHDAYHEAIVDASVNSSYDRPHSFMIQPVFADLYDPDDSEIAGHVFGLFSWDTYMANLLPEGENGIVVVIENDCNQTYTYQLMGSRAKYLGDGDLHDPTYNGMKTEVDFFSLDRVEREELLNTEGGCVYFLSIYPTEEFAQKYDKDEAVITTLLLAVAFAFMIGVFLMFDLFVVRRNRKLLDAVTKTNAIVTSLFPSNVRDRLMADAEQEKKERKGHTNGKNLLKSYLSSGHNGDAGMSKASDDDDTDNFMYKTKPIADLFAETTVLFADLAGFTAWSSMREPTQVFILLETIYKAMDDIAKIRRVFKVETVGDCYVAVTGLPDPRKDHAVVMCRFAIDSMHRMQVLTRKLEVILGPDTTDLNMRVGIHSGPVTAGVLRGERSRFQLFGDTMNTASRMESNGLPGKIQLSQETADLLITAGKEHWLAPREDKIIAKGKGELQTYWLTTTKSSSHGQSESNESEESNEHPAPNGHADVELPDAVPMMDEKTDRLVQWNVEVLLTLLKKVVARRREYGHPESALHTEGGTISTTPLDEVQEIIHLPKFERNVGLGDDGKMELGEAVPKQLREYVAAVASMYRSNPFHNFEHASHVTMSVVKLLSRIVAPDVDAVSSDYDSTLHDYTYGITSDPLTQFACVFSALIHDVDHPGIPNTQLISENPQLAKFYKEKSVAEQNSVDLSWDLLQDSTFAELRAAICPTDDERIHFRQLVVNSVMATDIMDKDLKTLRNARWEKAFSGANNEESAKDAIDRKATIVIEHLIQASDVAHTMQHWHIYRKWNQRLFEELYSAYIDGRSANDPSQNWYKGEIGFFDFYIIPLAKKLRECGVFGVSSDEYLNYAEKNRAEWEQRGQEVVSVMMEVCTKKYGTKQAN